MFGVAKLRTFDAFYYQLFVPYFHKKLNITPSSYEHFCKIKDDIKRVFPYCINDSFLFMIMVYLSTKNVNTALNFLPKDSPEFEKAKDEINLWDTMERSHLK